MKNHKKSFSLKIHTFFTGVTLLSWVFLVIPAKAQNSVEKTVAQGSICIAAVSEPTPGDYSLGNPTGGKPEPNYSVQIDDGDIIKIPRLKDKNAKDTLIPNLHLTNRHLLTIRHKNKIIESFYFRFEEGENKLCLFLNDMYLTWQLQSNSVVHQCACK